MRAEKRHGPALREGAVVLVFMYTAFSLGLPVQRGSKLRESKNCVSVPDKMPPLRTLRHSMVYQVRRGHARLGQQPAHQAAWLVTPNSQDHSAG